MMNGRRFIQEIRLLRGDVPSFDAYPFNSQQSSRTWIGEEAVLASVTVGQPTTWSTRAGVGRTEPIHVRMALRV